MLKVQSKINKFVLTSASALFLFSSFLLPSEKNFLQSQNKKDYKKIDTVISLDKDCVMRLKGKQNEEDLEVDSIIVTKNFRYDRKKENYFSFLTDKYKVFINKRKKEVVLTSLSFPDEKIVIGLKSIPGSGSIEVNGLKITAKVKDKNNIELKLIYFKKE
ncbi:MAG: hypothetical protein ACK4J0_02040 [Candidatus Anstonellaceae archaeon]